jgi:hypothetical protein
MEWQKWAIIVGAIVAGAATWPATEYLGMYQPLIGAIITLIGALVK